MAQRPVAEPQVAAPPQQLSVETVQRSVHTASKPDDVAGSVRYVLSDPVTVRRGGSTMVSILNKPIAAEDAFHVAMGIASGLLLVAGVGGLTLRTPPRTPVAAADCAGGQLAGQPLVVAELPTESATGLAASAPDLAART